jgi:uncharacterized membrane protein
MYNDKTDAGLSAEEVLEEFGSPKSCAGRILTENGSPTPSLKKSIGWWVAISFLTLLLILPIYASLFAVIISLGAAAFSCGVSAVAGVVYSAASPFFAFMGFDFWGVISHMGIGFAATGVSLLLATGFFFATKYLYKWTIHSLVLIYKRR